MCPPKITGTPFEPHTRSHGQVGTIEEAYLQHRDSLSPDQQRAPDTTDDDSLTTPTRLRSDAPSYNTTVQLGQRSTTVDIGRNFTLPRRDPTTPRPARRSQAAPVLPAALLPSLTAEHQPASTTASVAHNITPGSRQSSKDLTIHEDSAAPAALLSAVSRPS